MADAIEIRETKKTETDYLTCAMWRACKSGAALLHSGGWSRAVHRLGLREPSGERQVSLKQLIIRGKDTQN